MGFSCFVSGCGIYLIEAEFEHEGIDFRMLQVACHLKHCGSAFSGKSLTAGK